MPVADVLPGNIAKSALYVLSCPEGGERERLQAIFGERNAVLAENFDELLAECVEPLAERDGCDAGHVQIMRRSVYLITGAVLVAAVSAERREVAKLQAELEHLVSENLRLRGELKKRL